MKVMKKKISIGMLRSGARPGNRALAMAYIGQHKGVEVYFFGIDDVDIVSKKINAKKLVNGLWVNEIIDYPMVIDNDNVLSIKNKEKFEDLELNSYLTTQVFGGKLKTLNLLRNNNIFTEYLIPQEVIRNKSDFIEFIHLHSKSVLKPIRGSQGKGIYFINNKNSNFSFNFEGNIQEINNLDDFYDSVIRGKNFIIQKYIESITSKGAPFDIRIHLLRNGKNEWVNIKNYARVGTSENMTSNISRGGGISNLNSFIRNTFKNKSEKILNDINFLSKKFPQIFQKFYDKEIDAIGLDLGIDINGSLWIFEINSFPGTQFFELEEAIVRIDYLKYLYEREVENKSILVNFFDKNKLLKLNLIIDSQINSKEINVAVLKSLSSRVGVSDDFIKKNINNINYIISDKQVNTNNYPQDKLILLDDKESEIISTGLAKRQNLNPFVYTIIGSVGKTSVLALLSRSLKKIQKETYVNDFGNTPFYIAKGIFSAPLNSKNWVFEVAGATSFRDKPISVHSHDMLQPNVCIFTNIAEAHVGEIGSLKNVAEIKSKALRNVPNEAIIILNNDMPFQDIIRSNINPLSRVFTYGESNDSDFNMLESANNILKFKFQGKEYSINIPNDIPKEIKLNFLSVTAALILTQKEWSIACEYFLEWKPVSGRGNLEYKKIKDKYINIINDAYNANPTSMKLALSSFNNKIHSGRKIAVLSEISELGIHNDRIHNDILSFLSKIKLDKVILIGSSYIDYVNYNENYIFYKNILEFKNSFYDLVNSDDLILFKGSNSSLLYDFLKKI